MVFPDQNSYDRNSADQLSIVIPAYNEEGNLRTLYQELMKVLPSLDMVWEIVFVDDGSTDGTWQKIEALHKMDRSVKGIRFSRNFGHQYALFAGLSQTIGEVVVTMDADLQHPPHVIPRLVDEWRKGHRIVHTKRIDPQDFSRLKKTTSKLFYKVFSLLSGVKLESGMADFRLLDRQVVNSLLAFREDGLFLRGLVRWVGYPSSSVEFHCADRLSGTSKYTFKKMLKFSWHGISSFSVIPLRLGIVMGLLTSVLAFYQLGEALIAKLFTDKAIPGWASIIGLQSLLFGILFILLGVIGEYIARILEGVRQRPRFIVSETVGRSGEGSLRPTVVSDHRMLERALGETGGVESTWAVPDEAMYRHRASSAGKRPNT